MSTVFFLKHRYINCHQKHGYVKVHYLSFYESKSKFCPIQQESISLYLVTLHCQLKYTQMQRIQVALIFLSKI